MTPASHIPINLIAFEPFLEDLKNQGFAIGVGTYGRVHQLLNQHANRPEEELATFQAKLCALVATSPDEQKQFDRMFAGYLRTYVFSGEQTEDQDDEDILIQSRLQRFRNGLIGAGILGTLLITYIYLTQFYIQVIAGPVAAQLPGSMTVMWADTSQVIDFPPLFSDSIVKRTWGRSREAEPIWWDTRATLPKIPIRDSLRVLTKRGKRAKQAISYPLQPIVKIRGINPQITDKTVVFSAPLAPFKIDTLSWPKELKSAFEEKSASHKLLERTHRWDFGDGKTSVEATPKHDFDAYGIAYKIRLIVKETWSLAGEIHTWADSASLDLPLERKKLELPEVPLKYRTLTGPPIDEVRKLIEPLRPNYLPFYIGAVLLFLYLLYELYRWYKTRLVLDHSKGLDGPLRQDLVLQDPEYPGFSDDAHEKAFLTLRLRQSGEADDLDLLATLEATTEAAGFPTFLFRQRTRSPHYLVLIEQQHPGDHLAGYYAEMVEELGKRDISAETYFYHRHLRLCWKDVDDRDSRRSLGQLLSAFSDYRLIVMGSAASLPPGRSRQAGDTAGWLEGWETRALLCTTPTGGWNYEEIRAADLIPVFPATADGVGALVEQWASEEDMLTNYWIQQDPQPEPPVIPEEADEETFDWEASGLIEELRAYLGPDGFQWLCATALYPEMYYELTMALGKLIVGDSEILHVLTRRLLGLVWFREGEFPETLREALVGKLTNHNRELALTFLIEILEQEENQPPDNSIAEDEQRNLLAIYTFLRSQRDRAARRNLAEELKNLHPDDLEDRVVIKTLEEVNNNPLAIILPKGMFRKGLPFFGFQSQARAMGMAFLLALFALVWWKFGGNPLEQGLPDEPFRQEHLRADLTPQDSLIWTWYQGKLLADSGAYSAAADTLIRVLDTKKTQPVSFSGEIYEGFVYDSREVFTNTIVDLLRIKQSENREEVPNTEIWPFWKTDSSRLSRIKLTFSTDTSFWNFRYLLALVDIYEEKYIEGIAELDSVAQTGFLNPSAQPNSFNDTLAARNSLIDLLNVLKSELNPSDQLKVLSLLDSLGETIAEPEILLAQAREKLSIARRESTEPNWQAAKTAWETFQSIDPTQSEGLAELKSCDSALQTFMPPIATIELKVTSGGVPLSDATVWHERAGEAGKTGAQGEYIISITPWVIGQEEEIRVNKEGFLSDTIRVVLTEAVVSSQSILVDTTKDRRPELLATARDLTLIAGPLSDSLKNQAPKDTVLAARLDSLVLLLPSWGTNTDQQDQIVQETRALEGFIDRMEQAITAARTFLKQGDISFTPTPSIFIQGGTFLMGSEDELDYAASPVHSVTVSSFYMDATEVTHAQYAYFLNVNPEGNKEEGGETWYDSEGSLSRIKEIDNTFVVEPGYENHPVTYVSWYGAGAYAAWLSTYTGESYRLPTEAEWEYAAGGGLQERDSLGNRQYRYAGSDDMYAVGWYRDNANSDTHPVGDKDDNGLGLYDMSGNVFEWCSDWYGAYPPGAQTDPAGPVEGSYRVPRGGSWNSVAVSCRVAPRSYDGPSYRLNYLGFRLAR